MSEFGASAGHVAVDPIIMSLAHQLLSAGAEVARTSFPDQLDAGSIEQVALGTALQMVIRAGLTRCAAGDLTQTGSLHFLLGIGTGIGGALSEFDNRGRGYALGVIREAITKAFQLHDAARAAPPKSEQS